MPEGVTRRRLIAMSLLGFGGLALKGCTREGSHSILAQLKASPKVAGVGRAYLAAHPNENDAALLSQQLRLERDWASVEEEIRNDYRDGRVTRLSGWLISQTEGRLYALASLQVDH
jgi:hypothetical protein